MDNHPGIVIDTAMIKRVNTDALFTQGYLCAPTSEPQPSAAEMDRAISGIRITDHPDQLFHAVQVSQGTAIYVYPVNSTSHALDIAEMIADAISTVGFTGTVTACSDKLGPRPRISRSAFTAAICAVDAAVDNNETPLRFRARKKNLDRWATTTPEFRNIVDGLVRWAESSATGPILAGLHFTLSRCEPHQAVEVITRCCEDVGWAELVFATNDGDRFVRFTGEGWIIPGVDTKADEAEALKTLIQLLEEMAACYDYAAIVRTSVAGSARSVLVQAETPGPNDLVLSSDHGAMKTSIPGVFGAQVLGPGHAELQPPELWQVTNFSAGRRMFTAPNAEEWWEDEERRRPEEGFAVLKAANRALLGRWY